MKTADPEAGPIDRILALAREIIEDCPTCAGRVLENALWAGLIRERRPDREELVALVEATCGAQLPDGQKAHLVEGLRALVRFAE